MKDERLLLEHILDCIRRIEDYTKVTGNCAYVVDGNKGMQIFDVSRLP